MGMLARNGLRLARTRRCTLTIILAHLFPMHHFLPPEIIRKPYGFLMFSEGRERVHR